MVTSTSPFDDQLTWFTLFDAMCDKEVAPGKSLDLVKKLITKNAGRTGGVLAFVKESKEKGDALAKAVEEKIAEK